MNELKVLDYGEEKIRIADLSGQLWFSSHDVATVLGYKRLDDAISFCVDVEDQRLLQREEIPVENPIPHEVLPVTFVRAEIPEKGLPIVNVMGLCSLIMSSKTEAAKDFKQWVLTIAIPSMRVVGTCPPSGTHEKLVKTLEELMQARQEIANMKVAAAQKEAEDLRLELEFALGTDEASERKRAQSRERVRRFRERQKKTDEDAN